ncbi:lipopolysaccharide biosynthesis protein [Balneola vulgaris]|uniref:lipopolysaccharide biosynthesis protein n=1 Tax=Balneola vulgaris TaxID=287535 RepID=UPI000376F109|nr:lipopolysaccharide biosynthesis protein [Balneola vulgaris]
MIKFTKAYILNKLNLGGFVKGALTLSFGTFIGQLLVVATSPFLTRIYSPEEFGIFGLLLSVVASFALISALRYELAIILPENDILAMSLLLISIVFVSSISLSLFFLILIFQDFLVQLPNGKELITFSWLIPCLIFLAGTIKVFVFWNLRINKPSKIAYARMTQDSIMVGYQSSTGYFFFNNFMGLSLGYGLGLLLGLIVIAKQSIKRNIVLLKLIRAKHIKYVLYRYKRFPLFTVWADLANVLSKQLPMVIIASLFSPAIAGFYLMANRVANSPVGLISEGTGKSFMSIASKLTTSDDLGNLSIKVFDLLIKMSVIPLVFVAAFGPELFGLLFGDEWSGGGRYFQALIVQSIAVFIFVPILTLLAVLEKQELGLYFQISMLIFTLISLYMGYLYQDSLLAIMLYSFTTAFSYFYFGILLLFHAGVKVKMSLKKILPEIAIGLIIFSIIELYKSNVNQFFDGSILMFLFITFVLAVLTWIIFRCYKSFVELNTLDRHYA